MFKFKGISSTDMQVIIEEEEHFIARAAKRYETIEIEGRDGAIFNELGYSYVERPIYVQCLNINKIDDILAWLDGEGEFEYKGRKTTARFYSQLEPQREGYIRIIDTTFIRDPFWIKANEEFVTVKESKVTETEESKSIHVEDASTIGQLEVLGNHKQENRSGKNKLNLANIQQTTKNGITCTYNEDGSVTFNGTCTADNTSFVINNTNIDAIKNQTTMSAFYEKGNISANEGKTAYIYARINTSDYSKMLSFIIADLNNSNPVISEQYKSDDTLLNQFSFRIESGTILNKFTVKIMITDTPEEATEYEQYGATPSPEYPSPVKCLGSNKNLYDGTNKNYYINISANSCGISEGNTGSIVDVKGKSNVTISSSIAQTKFRAGCINSEVTGNTAVTLYNGLNKDNSIEMTINCEEYNYLVINATDLSKIKVEEGTEATSYSSFGQGSTLISKINKNFYDKTNVIQKGLWGNNTNHMIVTNHTGWYVIVKIIGGKTYTISRKNGEEENSYLQLAGTPTADFPANGVEMLNKWTQDLQNNGKKVQIQTAENANYLLIGLAAGQISEITEEVQTLAMEELMVNIEDNEISYIEHQQEDYLLYIQQEMLQGDYFIKEDDGWKEVHGWNKIILTGNENLIKSGASSSDKLIAVLAISNGIDGFGYSNYFKYSETFGIGNFRVYNNGTNLAFGFDSTEIATLEEAKSFLTEKYNAGNPVYFYYKTATPTKLPCTKEQSAVLEELNNLDLFEGVNNIITAEDIALLELKYMKITNEKINNKGNVESRPILRLEKTSTESVELTINNCSFKYNFNDEEYVEIDCEQKEVKYEGLNRNRQIEIGYEFPILNVGDNDIKMHSGDCVIKVLRKDRWL